MNLLNEFERGLTIESYKKLLNDQLRVHNLHYDRAQIDSDALSGIPPLKILVITEPWCGDSTAILPVIQKLFEDHDTEIRVLLRDQNPELIDRFLTNGARAIPILLILDAKGNFLAKYGPRPETAQAIFEAHRDDINSGKIEKSKVIRKIRTFYSKDRGKTILNSFLNSLGQTIRK